MIKDIKKNKHIKEYYFYCKKRSVTFFFGFILFEKSRNFFGQKIKKFDYFLSCDSILCSSVFESLFYS